METKMDLSSKVEILLGSLALVFSAAMFLATYSWATPAVGYFSYRSTDSEPIRTLGILVLLIAVLSVIQGFRISFLEITLGLFILLWLALILGWFFPGGMGSAYNEFQSIDVSFTHAQLISYASIGITLEIAMIAHGIYKGKKGEYKPEHTR